MALLRIRVPKQGKWQTFFMKDLRLNRDYFVPEDRVSSEIELYSTSELNDIGLIRVQRNSLYTKKRRRFNFRGYGTSLESVSSTWTLPAHKIPDHESHNGSRYVKTTAWLRQRHCMAPEASTRYIERTFQLQGHTSCYDIVEGLDRVKEFKHILRSEYNDVECIRGSTEEDQFYCGHSGSPVFIHEKNRETGKIEDMLFGVTTIGINKNTRDHASVKGQVNGIVLISSHLDWLSTTIEKHAQKPGK